jgi:protein-L-isoaspartate(D-aspartate) O-methyltransferase
VLDIGCGSGYSAAVFARIAASVVAIEAARSLCERARANIEALGLGNVTLVERPHAEGCPEHAPYDVIFIGGAVDEVPSALLGQLAEGGRLVAVVGRGNAGMARLYVSEAGVVSGRRAFNAAVKPLPGFEKEPAFQF